MAHIQRSSYFRWRRLWRRRARAYTMRIYSSLPPRRPTHQAPGRCSDRDRCEEGDSNLEPILVAHNVLLVRSPVSLPTLRVAATVLFVRNEVLRRPVVAYSRHNQISIVCVRAFIAPQAHASAVAKFRQRFLGRQGYEIGMTNCGFMTYPLRESDTERNQEFLEAEWAWFFDPVIYGDYPESIKKRVGSAMPSFTPEQSAMLKGSIDFLGVNYYTSRWVSVPDETHDASLSANGIPFLNSMFSVTAYDDNLIPIGSQAGSEWLYIVPEGIHDLLIWLAARYPANPVTGKSYELRITENGLSLPWWLELTEDDSLNDTFRVDYYRAHIEEVARAISEGVRVTAYYAWSLMDNYEWADGYSKRFGIVYVDYGTLTRIPKLSAWWYSALIDAHAATHRLGPPTTSGSTVLASFMSKRTTALAGPVGVIVVASMLAFVLAVQRNKGTKAMSMRIELPVLFSTKAIQGHERNGYNRIP